MINLLDFDKEQMKGLFSDRPYRGSQIFSWVFGKAVRDISEMTNLSKQFRQELSEKAVISYPELVRTEVSSDGTEKLAYRLHDGHVIESVLMPEKEHYSLCISSQVGCAMGCVFCFTATMGFKRNLAVSEIVAQVLSPLSAYPDRQIRNIVFMGMGEPLLNYDNVIRTIRILTDKEGPQFSKRRITLSTCGILPKLTALWKDTETALAVSLNAPSSEIRGEIMPVTKKYPLEELLGALKAYQLPNRRRITIEYVLIKGVNDRIRDARELIRILHGLKVKVNLIPFNPWPGCHLEAPDPGAVLAFEEVLKDSPYAVMLRREKGKDILAACGQLAGRVIHDGQEAR